MPVTHHSKQIDGSIRPGLIACTDYSEQFLLNDSLSQKNLKTPRVIFKERADLNAFLMRDTKVRRYRILETEDTIAAIATPVGVGGISIVRISGARAFPISDKIFLGKTKLSDAVSHSAHFGKVIGENENLLDEVIAVVFRKPASYTCEDIVEIQCHGGYLAAEKVLSRVLEAGARFALPGEFTKRAFLNGRIDLSQAEAIGDLIHSQSEAAYQSSIRQLTGELSRKIKEVRDELINLASLLELELDFSEENVEFADRPSLVARLADSIGVVTQLLSSYSVGKLYKEGVRVAIAGRPNVGKSSLLNALLEESRAIVSEIPGTTRDTISESLEINGILFRLTDTAGLRETADDIESEGVQRAKREIEDSDIVLLVSDYQDFDYNGTDLIYQELSDNCHGWNTKLVSVWNKIDLYASGAPRTPENGFFVSALKGEGIALLKRELFNAAFGENVNEKSVIVTNIRHRDALLRAKDRLELALEALKNQKSSEFVTIDLRAGLNALGEITGEVTTDDILEHIFSKFCIGK